MTHSPFPECVKALGHALAPLSQRIHAVLTESQQRSVLDQSSIERVGNALDKLQEQIEALETIINHDFTALVECTVDEGVLNAHRIAGKLESTLGTMLVAYRRYDGSDEYPYLLLAAIHRHTLTEIVDWIDEVIEVIDNPIHALQRRHLPTMGRVELDLALRLTPAPELMELEQYYRARGIDQRHSATQRRGLGFWGWAAVIGLGLWLGSGGCDEGE
ncbi:MAG: hypothetical protein ACOZAI_08415 [Pseudomonadota bacterium]